MKTNRLIACMCGAILCLSSAACFAQPPQAKQGMPMPKQGAPMAKQGMPMPKVDEALVKARKAEAERELIPRSDKMGLLVVFHGAGSPSWNSLTDSIVAKVAEQNNKEKKFLAVAGANMEFTLEGDIVDGVKKLEDAGCDVIIAVPAFIYPTSHVQFDVVSVLGIYGTAEHRAAMREEGTRSVRTKLPIVMAGTFADGDLLKDYIVDQAKSISTDPKNERVLVVAHGDEGYQGMVDHLTKPALDAVAELGFDKVDAAYVEMGQAFAKNAKPIVEANTKDGKKTLIVAVYLASAGKSFVERLAQFNKESSLEGLDWVGNELPLGKFQETATHIFNMGVAASLY